MFKLAKERKVWWPVRLPTVNAEGEVAHVTIRAQFVLLKAEELMQLRIAPLQQVQDAGATSVDAIIDRINSAERDMAARVAAHTVGWDGVVDQDSDEPVPFSAAALAMAMDYADVRQAFATALREASTGAAPKN